MRNMRAVETIETLFFLPQRIRNGLTQKEALGQCGISQRVFELSDLSPGLWLQCHHTTAMAHDIAELA